MEESAAALRAATAKLASGRRWARPLAFATCAIALLCIAGFLVWTRVTAPRRVLLTQITHNESQNRVTAAAISPDGASLAYAEAGGFFIRRISSGETNPLPSPPHLRTERIAWFNDGSGLLISGFDATSLAPSKWVVSKAAMKPALFRTGAYNGPPSPDGRRLAFTTEAETEIWVAGPGGEQPRKVIGGGPSESFPFLFWSADGKRLSYQRVRRRPRPSDKPTITNDLEASYDWAYESADAGSGKLLASASNLPITSACAFRDGRVFILSWGPGDKR